MAGSEFKQGAKGILTPPRLSVEHPDYILECEEALEPALISTIDAALAAGWEKGAIWQALLSLSLNLEIAQASNMFADLEIHLGRPVKHH